jgi:hypothetical protein
MTANATPILKVESPAELIDEPNVSLTSQFDLEVFRGFSSGIMEVNISNRLEEDVGTSTEDLLVEV